MRNRFALAENNQLISRRSALHLAGGFALLPVAFTDRSRAVKREISIGLTPVFLNDDLELLWAMRAYFESALKSPIKLVIRRTYQEITSLLLSGQLEAAWICGYPFVEYRQRLDLLAVPVWRGKPLYQSYLLSEASNPAPDAGSLRGGIHAFSDPNSNSGYLVTAALLAELGLRPSDFFSRAFFTDGHRNVVRAVASGLANSGSVDGYVWEVLTETEPGITRATRIVRKSEWLGFPPVATTREALSRPEVQALQHAFLDMGQTADGRRVLNLLKLDSFTLVSADIFDPIVLKAEAVKRVG